MAAPATLRERVRVTEERYFVAKRLLDVALAVALLVLLLPLMALVAALVAFDSPGPVLFKQKRVGEDGEHFDMYKFRSMCQNADAGLHRAAVKRFMQGERLNHERTTDAPYKLGDDPRITRIGRFIRKTSLDELPQLWNIIIGDMSFVGPRPPVPYEVEMYSPQAMKRLHGKPGLTGPWQVYGRGTVSYSKMIEMDVAYLSTRSIWYDLKLIVLTAPAAVRGKGGV
jgi:lipopolysaccharide/colanic/teichoic acid biosynthesis glycosyltransferase